MIVAGCVAQAENEEMIKREPYIDLVIGPQSYHKINGTILDHIQKNHIGPTGPMWKNKNKQQKQIYIYIYIYICIYLIVSHIGPRGLM